GAGRARRCFLPDRAGAPMASRRSAPKHSASSRLPLSSAGVSFAAVILSRWVLLVVAAIILASGSPSGIAPVRAAAQGIVPSFGEPELLQVLGEGVVGSSE